MLRRRRVTYGGHIAQVEPGSIAEEIGIRQVICWFPSMGIRCAM